MTDHSDLIARLREPCIDWTGEPIVDGSTPRTEVHCGLLREASDALSSQSLSLSEAREEIERLRGESANLAACCETMEAECVKWVDRVNAAEKALKTFVAHYPMGINPFLDDAFRAARSALENGPAVLADATNDPAETDLSSLRKGAEEHRAVILEALKQAASGGASGLADHEIEEIANDLLASLSQSTSDGRVGE